MSEENKKIRFKDPERTRPSIRKPSESLNFKIEENEIYTNNEGVLTKIEPFTLLRGTENKGKKMGQAKNEKGKIFDIYTDECGLMNSCYCGGKAVLKTNKSNI